MVHSSWNTLYIHIYNLQKSSWVVYKTLTDSGLDTPAAESQQILQTTRMTNALDWLPILKALKNICKAGQGMPLGTTVHFRCRTEIEGVWEENHVYIQLKDVGGGNDMQGNLTVSGNQCCQ